MMTHVLISTIERNFQANPWHNQPTIGAPEMLKVNEGFHHDLNANDIDELSGPIFPCKNEVDIFQTW